MSNARPDVHDVVVVDDAGLTQAGRLAAALDRTGFWEILTPPGQPAESRRLLIKPELAGFTAASPLATDPSLVEALIDLLHDRGFADVAVVGTADGSAFWAENRDLYALTDLLGYRFVTPKGRPYDIIDLADVPDETVFPAGSALCGTGISRAWIDADFRIVFAKYRTDEEAGFALSLDTLIGVLPLTDKSLHYRQRRHPGDVVTALLAVAPVQFALIDAITSVHGGGRRAADPIDTGTLLAASDIVLADYIGALKMGLDPAVSPTLARVMRSHPLPLRYTVSGTLEPYRGWRNVPVPVLRSTQARTSATTLDHLVEPWLQCLDPELFPLQNPLDARVNATLAEFFADADDSTTSQHLLILVNVVLGFVGRAVESYRTLFDKDRLHQRAVPLGIDLTSLEDAAFERLVDELVKLEPIAASAPKVSDSLGWRYVEEAIVFNYSRTLPIDFDAFVQCVDVARTIQFMNDYLGGVIVPVAHDAAGRPVRQAERNIYLPQPNYLVLSHGKPIDVSKLEVVEYGTDRHRLYWKTIGSENGSATYDDGIATFQRSAEGTSITILGRQLFALPLFWQVFDLNLVPEVRSMLVAHAYGTFFDRTLANFEALVEGRDIRLGRPVDEPVRISSEQFMDWLGRFGETASALLECVRPQAADAAERRETDADGFVHVHPASQAQYAADVTPQHFDGWIAGIARFVAGLQQAAQRDLAQRSQHR